MCECSAYRKWSVSLLGDATAAAGVILPLTPHYCLYVKPFREVNMRSYAAWLQRGHLKPGCSSAFTSAKVAFLSQGSSVVFCWFRHSSESRTRNPDASKVVFRRAQTENTHASKLFFFSTPLSFPRPHKNLFPVFSLSRTHTLTPARSEREEDR